MLTVQRLEGWTVSVPAGGGVANVIAAIGRDNFVNAGMGLFDEAIGIHHLSVFRLSDRGGIDYHGAASSDGPGRSAEIAGLYLKRFSHLDPVRAVAKSGLACGTGMLVRLRAADVISSAYRQEVYEAFNIGERLTLYAGFERKLYQLNLYRSTDHSTFTESEVGKFVELSSIVLPALAKHAELTAGHSLARRPSLEALRHRIAALDRGLSDREMEVCARAVYGQSIRGTSLEMDIKSTSVITYRRRAYAKLGISCHNELFAALAF